MCSDMWKGCAYQVLATEGTDCMNRTFTRMNRFLRPVVSVFLIQPATALEG
jgi:hypothetical protein